MVDFNLVLLGLEVWSLLILDLSLGPDITWVVVKVEVPFLVLIIRHLILRVPNTKGP